MFTALKAIQPKGCFTTLQLVLVLIANLSIRISIPMSLSLDWVTAKKSELYSRLYANLLTNTILFLRALFQSFQASWLSSSTTMMRQQSVNQADQIAAAQKALHPTAWNFWQRLNLPIEIIFLHKTKGVYDSLRIIHTFNFYE